MKSLVFDAKQVVLLKETLESSLEGLQEALEYYGEEEKEDLQRECAEIENLLVKLS